MALIEKMGTLFLGILGIYYLYIHNYLVSSIYLFFTIVMVVMIIKWDYLFFLILTSLLGSCLIILTILENKNVHKT